MAEALVNFDLNTALQEAERRFTAANPRSEQRFRKAAESMPGGNTRTVLHYSPFPVAFQGGSGAKLTDIDGHTYTDFLGEFSAGLYGHSDPRIVAAAQKAIAAGLALGGPNEHEAELASLVKARFPSIDLMRFCNSGTEANLMALATARAITGRSHIMAFLGGYHGGVLSFPNGPSIINAPFPTIMASYNDTDGAVSLIERHKDELAVVIVEPMMGSAGGLPADRSFLLALREATAKHGIVLLFDEVMTSRLSPGGLQEKLGIRPDLTTFGKYLGGGFNIGAFGGARWLMERFDPTRADYIAHAGTFNNNTMTMAAGVVGLRDIYTPEASLALTELGEGFREKLNALFKAKGVAMQMTGVGSLMNIQFQGTPIRRPADVLPAKEKRALIHLEMMARGFYFARRGYLTLSLALEGQDFEGFVTALGSVVDEYQTILRD